MIMSDVKKLIVGSIFFVLLSGLTIGITNLTNLLFR
jgi:hypothetical protein